MVRCRLCWPLREQARSHIGRCTHINCGSEPAREGGVSERNRLPADHTHPDIFIQAAAPEGCLPYLQIHETFMPLLEHA